MGPTSGRHPALPHTEAPHEYAPTHPAPPASWQRWGWLLGATASALGMLALLGGLLVWCGASPPWPTRAEAQQVTARQDASIATAKADCAQQIRDAVGAQTARLTALEVASGRLDQRTEDMADQQRRMSDLLEKMALRQGLRMAGAHGSPAPLPVAAPAVAPGP